MLVKLLGSSSLPLVGLDGVEKVKSCKSKGIGKGAAGSCLRSGGHSIFETLVYDFGIGWGIMTESPSCMVH